MIPAITSHYELGNSANHLHHHHIDSHVLTTTSQSLSSSSSNIGIKLSSSGGISPSLSSSMPIEIPSLENRLLDVNREYNICNTNYTRKEFDRSQNSSPTLLSIFAQPNSNNSGTVTPQSPVSPVYSQSTTPIPKIYNNLSNIFEDQPTPASPPLSSSQQNIKEYNEVSSSCIINNPATSPALDSSAVADQQQSTTPSSSSIQSQRKRSISMSIPDLNLLSHQVAGQAPLFKLPDGKILKPLVSTEYQFYKSLESHTEFLDFTPKFYGTIDLKYVDHDYLEKSCRSTQQSSSIFDYNHWRNKIVKLPKENQNLYIKIEDLTYLCKYPCILDLKMGVRQYGNDAPPEKMYNMDSKCKATTSSALGFRVCGLKVFDQRTSQYQTFDKYYGRQLKPSDIPMVICKFLDNGIRLRVELLTAIAKRLNQLVSLFEQQQCYKFYGGSLLFIYDGQSNNMQSSKLNIKMVDFAHASPNAKTNAHNTEYTESNNNRDLDEGYLFGLRNLLKIINTLIQLSSTASTQNTI